MNQMRKCHLIESTPKENDLIPTSERFIVIKVLVEISHIFRYILKCNKCGQLFFYEFYEEIDWVKGKDPQWNTYIPVNTVEEAELLNKKSQLELLGVTPRLQNDLVEDSNTVKWIR